MKYLILCKVSRKQAQGALFGYFAMSGSLARMFFPVLAGYSSGSTSSDSILEFLIPILMSSAIFVIGYGKQLRELSI